MIRVLYGLQVEREDVRQVGTSRFLVDWAFIEPGVFTPEGVDSVDVADWEGGKENLGRGLDQLAVTSVPSCTVQEQAMDVYTCRGTRLEKVSSIISSLT